MNNNNTNISTFIGEVKKILNETTSDSFFSDESLKDKFQNIISYILTILPMNEGDFPIEFENHLGKIRIEKDGRMFLASIDPIVPVTSIDVTINILPTSSLKVIKGEYVEVAGDCNLYDVYEVFNKLHGLNLEFDLNESYGSGCYGMVYFDEKNYPSQEELEQKIEHYKNKTLPEYHYLTEDDIVNYLRRRKILPEIDLLFQVDY